MQIRSVFTVAVATTAFAVALAGCAGIQQQIAAKKARGTIEAGGYTWEIPDESEGGNTVSTHGLPPKQAATEASSILCKKYGRVAQFVKKDGILLTGLQIFSFNCVR
jgi:uncharacterized protein YceK